MFFSCFFSIVVCYILSSVPFGLLLTKFFHNQDLRDFGSGNIGATNVLRIAGKKIGLLTLTLDFAKSFIPLFLIKHLVNYSGAILFAGLASVLGHIFPVWLGFKGGKGVATALGVYFAYDLMLGGISCLTWVCIFLPFRYSSLSSIFMVIITAVISFMFYLSEQTMALTIIAVIIVISHYRNILRLVKGEEKKIN
ncbi:MAG: glycerol-3-phosphate 1-O-acyltransferase PlsY [Rickettsiaceae bacterium H1]|nr:glycerol-3-phosphate 1-O-acyltransferase PlsY [Rickettsiaceae bacterium H1]